VHKLKKEHNYVGWRRRPLKHLVENKNCILLIPIIITLKT
jgi:hypothetical protein